MADILVSVAKLKILLLLFFFFSKIFFFKRDQLGECYYYLAADASLCQLVM